MVLSPRRLIKVATQSIGICIGSLLGIKRSRHKQTTAPQLAPDLAAGSGRKISRQAFNSRHPETGLYIRYPVRYVQLTASNRKCRILRGRKHQWWTP
ncbi:hypothetical protein TNCV_2225981 [Trichonephila clavipes]|nr:hypothetical protein TNCV_2225981 [Trichonephila clavipes]